MVLLKFEKFIGFEKFALTNCCLKVKMNMSKILQITEEKISGKIYLLRGKRAMMDFDLAEMYEVENENLKRQVRRNIDRFPGDFMFELTREEYNSLSRQIGGLKRGQHSKYPPFAFTEQGVAMLSSVLRSKTAMEVNIQIIRVFTRMRELISTRKDVFLKPEQLEVKLLKQDHQMNKHENEIQSIFKMLKQLINPLVEPRKRIGFSIGKEI